jgi:hypothetical protein
VDLDQEQRQKRARINGMRFFLNQFEYEGKDLSVVYPADSLIVQRGGTRSRTDGR